MSRKKNRNRTFNQGFQNVPQGYGVLGGIYGQQNGIGDPRMFARIVAQEVRQAIGTGPLTTVQRTKKQQKTQNRNTRVKTQGQGQWQGQQRNFTQQGFQNIGVGNDETIYRQVCTLLAQHPNIDGTQVQVQVRGGEVNLLGAVPDLRTKKLVGRILLDRLPNIQVFDNLRVYGGQQHLAGMPFQQNQQQWPQNQSLMS